MFTSVVHTDNLSSALQINDGVNFALITVDTHVELSERPKTPKMQQPGQWPVFTYARCRIWHMEGEILPGSAGTVGQHDTNRITMLNNILPKASATIRQTGTLLVTDENGETFQSTVTLTSHSCPIEANYPGVSSFMFEWEADDPLCYRVSDGIGFYI